jgi:hypothetical protein
LKIEHERNVVAGRDGRRWCSRFYPRFNFIGFARLSATRQRRIKELDLLRLAIFGDDKILRLQIRDVFSFFIFNDDVDVDEVGLNFDNFILLRVSKGGKRE